ncbi:F-box domain-containing protein [Westerdykella ornata]|uniref:F-box domain-containing protein n=1 Tax=Westerdykella ornata TaxID=318751 RepID=A0A6A6JZP6_WESOR|nr:F-box domain-containing protein [Westerdykella ornata]KAF2281256.1 F-box domain-containing protein [Westerdykella ornata]
MAPGTLLDHSSARTEVFPPPFKKAKLSPTSTLIPSEDAGEVEVAKAVPTHPLHIRPAGNAYTALENLKAHCGLFARLPDELLSHILESFDADSLTRLGSTCKALYAFTRLDELWRALFIKCPPEHFEWRGTWRATHLNIPRELVTSICCKNLFSDVLYRPFQCANTPLEPFVENIPAQNAIPRLEDLTYEEYAENWTNKPFILTSPVKEWPVYGSWTPQTLLEKYPDVKFRAEAVDWPTRKYIDYMYDNADESPLYVFDRAFAEKTGIKVGREAPDAAYWPPDCFGEDLFDVLGDLRPDCRWMIMGPKRSGSTFHKDPNATCAWNGVLTGSKYWLMFPSSPSLPPPPGVILSEDHSEITSPLSIAEYLLTFHALARRTPGCREGVCYAGEVLHVPSGWFHLVLNLEDSLALTQNFVPKKRLSDVLGFLRDQRDQVSGFREDVCDRAYELFVERLKEAHPHILEQGLQELERKSKKGRGRWEELTKADEEESGGFSFGFGGDDDDAEVP